MTARVLVQILSPEAGCSFVDDEGGVFVSDEGGWFDDSIGILKLSTEDFASTRQWTKDIINIDPIAYRMDQLYGGMVRSSGGGLDVSLSAFNATGWWLPAISYQCVISVTDTDDAHATTLMEGTLYRRNIDLPLSVSFDLYQKDYPTQLLSTVVDYDGNTVVSPKGFGAVSYVKPVRLPDSTTLIDDWVQKPDFSGLARNGAVSAVVGTKIYTGLGNAGGTLKNDWWEYDTSTKIWTQKLDFLGAARNYAVAAAVGTDIYVGTGHTGSGTFVKDWYKYDTLLNTWTAKLDFTGGNRYSAVAVAVGTKIYAGTGSDGTRKIDWWEYDTAANTWTAKLDFAGTARFAAVGAAVGTKIYVGTGDDGARTKDWWMYDTAANTWTTKLDLTGNARYGAIAATIGTKIYVGTGNDGAAAADLWEYDSAVNTWTAKNIFAGTVREYALLSAVNSVLYIFTGLSGTAFLRDFWTNNTTDYRRVYTTGGLTGISVYDDGVNVTSNAVIATSTFQYIVTPVGELTISGTGVSTQNYDIFSELCGAGWLNIGLVDEGTAIGTISRWQDTQVFVLDFLSQVASVTDAFFYVLGGTLYLHDMDMVSIYYGTVNYNVKTDLLEGTRYERAAPKSSARHKYKTRIAAEETIGKYVKEIDKEVSVLTPWAYGDEISVDTMIDTGNNTALWYALIYSVGTRFFAALPMQSTVLRPGTKVIMTDDRFTGKTITCTGHIRDFVFNFNGKKINIEGSTVSLLSA